jgi:hypothetical protein
MTAPKSSPRRRCAHRQRQGFLPGRQYWICNLPCVPCALLSSSRFSFGARIRSAQTTLCSLAFPVSHLSTAIARQLTVCPPLQPPFRNFCQSALSLSPIILLTICKVTSNVIHLVFGTHGTDSFFILALIVLFLFGLLDGIRFHNLRTLLYGASRS